MAEMSQTAEMIVDEMGTTTELVKRIHAPNAIVSLVLRRLLNQERSTIPDTVIAPKAKEEEIVEAASNRPLTGEFDIDGTCSLSLPTPVANPSGISLASKSANGRAFGFSGGRHGGDEIASRRRTVQCYSRGLPMISRYKGRHGR
jgi:hypothetical protein